ncbi:MAG: LamG domain-containing protein [Thermofilaceae archaeon]
MALAYPSFRTVEPLSPYLPENLRRGLVLYLWMNEGAGNMVYDLSGNGNHGTIYGATWTRLASGKNVLYFDGVDDYVVVPHSDVLNIAPGNQITIAMWAKFTGWQRGYYVGVPIDKRSENTANYNWEFNSTVMMMRVHGGGLVRVVIVPHSLNTWNFYAMVLNGSWLGGYLNGELKASRSDVPESRGNTMNLFIGQTVWYTFRVEGIIASVLIYNRALSDAEIRTLYELHRGLFAG